MIENLSLSTEKKSNRLKNAWAHLSKQQKITLGILSFVVVVLPLSLLLVKTQTNILPKAITPITAPITSPTPSPTPVPCNEQCPGSDGVLRSCTPPESDGSPQESLCGSSIFIGRVESCGNTNYCCDGNQWTADLSACPPAPSPTPSSRCQSCVIASPSCASDLRCAGEELGDTTGLCVRTDETIASCQPSPSPSPEVCTQIAGSCLHKNGVDCTGYSNGCEMEEKCAVPLQQCDYPKPTISLAGNTLPNDPRISYQFISVNELLLTQSASMSAKTTYLDNQDLLVEDGYGEFYMFYLQSPIEYEILARELDINSQGSYIKTVLYGADKQKITTGGTRIHYQAGNGGPYYLVVYTFEHQQGAAEITILNKFRKYLYPFVKRIDEDIKPLLGGSRLGRKPADFFLQVPLINNINNNYITYQYQTDENQLLTEFPRAIVTQTCPFTQQSEVMPIGIKKFNNPNQDPLREIRMKIYPQVATTPDGGAYYPPGYDYTVNLEYPTNQGWTTYFSTTSQYSLADLNDDSAVDLSDYSLLVSEFMHTTQSQLPEYLYSDLNCDDLVDISDYSLLIGNISL